MYSPNNRVYQQATENSGSIARKPDLSTTVKKPFVDISVNKTHERKSPKAFQKKQMDTLPEAETFAEKANRNYPDWLADISSYKIVEDTYQDIWQPGEKITKTNIASILCHVSVTPPPPPIKNTTIYPVFLENPLRNSFIEDCFTIPMDVIDDVPAPTDIFCDFAF